MKTWAERLTMDEIRLKKISAEYAGQIEACRKEFAKEALHVSYIPDRIPGLNDLENYENISKQADIFHCCVKI